MINAISELIEKLSLSNCPKRQGDFFDYFREIANLLMNKCVISKGKAKFEIVELEFYLFTPDHQDVITYPRDTKAGQWFFHQSGVDLAFERNTDHFGGILIRGLRNIKTGELTLGPQKCVDVLWDKFNAFDCNASEYPIISSDVIVMDVEPSATYRHIRLSKGKTKADKIKEWSDRLNATCVALNTTEEARANLVYDANYRFFKMEAIDQNDEAWKKYAAKPARLTT